MSVERMDDLETVWKPRYKSLPGDRLGIPGLHMMGCSAYTKAHDPLFLHYHKTMEIVVIVSGTQNHYVNDSSYTLFGGNAFITYPYEIHGNDEMPQKGCEFIWFQLEPEPRSDFLGLSGKWAELLLEKVRAFHQRILSLEPEMIAWLQEAWQKLSSEDEAMHPVGHAALLHFVTSFFMTEHSVKSDISPDIWKALHYINDHLQTSLSVMEIAADCGLSESRFKAKFKKELGITPLNYVNSRKIDAAKDLLQSSSMSVTDIAYQFDFASSNYFSSVFKKYTGYSPLEYRRKMSQRPTK